MILLDLNVLLDVVQKREPHYAASAGVIELAVCGDAQAALPVHAITTVHYIVWRYQGGGKANEVVDWLLRYFEVATVGHAQLSRARALNWTDFEDAVVAAAAESSGCQAVITRNVKDFAHSPVPAMTPEEYLLSIDVNID
ncbi:MAG: PIN domain-containing protein [Gammaproteobacteria bacterium]|nr:PIN domain-containing protein [Gammaproteobacteria bacterium]